MHKNSFRRQGDPVQVGWTVGRAPLALRGIRFANGEGGAAPAAPASPPEAPPAAPSPTDVAAMLAQLGKGTAPAAPAPQAPAPIQGFTPEQVQTLMRDADTASKTAADAQAALAAMQAERDALQAKVAEHTRVSAVTTAADGKANAALLLDSTKFLASLADLDISDAAKLGATVEQFVKDNPAYAAAPAAPPIPHTSGGTPAGGTTSQPNTLQAAVAARLGA